MNLDKVNKAVAALAREEARRMKVYRQLAKIDRWKETFEVLYRAHRTSAVKARMTNNPLAATYFEGKADGVEELMAKVEAAIKPQARKSSDKSVEVIL